MSAKFFNNLLSLVKEEKAAMLKVDSGYHCFVFEGKYWGYWKLKGNKTYYSLLPISTTDEEETFGEGPKYLTTLASLLGWKGWFQFVRDTPRSPDVSKLTLLYRRYCEKWDGLQPHETMLAAYGGYEWLDIYWSKHPEEQKDLEMFFKAKIFSKLGVRRRKTVAWRFLTTKRKKAFRKTYPLLPPRVINWMIDNTTQRPWQWRNTEPKELVEVFRDVTSQHADLDVLWRMRCLGPLEGESAKRELYLGAKANPGREMIYEVTLQEIIGTATSSSSRFDRMEVMLAALAGMGALTDEFRDWRTELAEFLASPFSTYPPEQMVRIHDRTIPLMQERIEVVSHAYLQARRNVVYDGSQSEVQAERAQVMAYVEKLNAEARDLWDRHLGAVEPGKEGFTLLRTELDYQKEGKNMDHCVATYYRNAAAQFRLPPGAFCRNYSLATLKEAGYQYKLWYVWHVESGGERGTFCFEYWLNEDGTLAEVTYNQLRGVKNKRVPQRLVDFVQAECTRMGWKMRVTR